MSDTSAIEKKSLEAHVELCAERYKMLELKMETVEEKITGLETMVHKAVTLMQGMGEKRNDQIVAWGLGLIGVLLSIIAWLASRFFQGL